MFVYDLYQIHFHRFDYVLILSSCKEPATRRHRRFTRPLKTLFYVKYEYENVWNKCIYFQPIRFCSCFCVNDIFLFILSSNSNSKGGIQFVRIRERFELQKVARSSNQRENLPTKNCSNYRKIRITEVRISESILQKKNNLHWLLMNNWCSYLQYLDPRNLAIPPNL